MYQFYWSEEEKAVVQIYNEGEITPEYAQHKIDNLTGGKSELYEPICLSLDMFHYSKAILPFSVSDEVMGIWKFHVQTLNTSRTYKEEVLDPYFIDEDFNDSDKVDLVRY